MAGVSSMKMGKRGQLAVTSTKRSKSRWPISPRRMRSPEMRASSDSRRVASWSALISSEKIAAPALGTALGSFSRASRSRAWAAPKAILAASAVLPMPGRPATISRSDGCSPPILARGRATRGQAGYPAGGGEGLGGMLDRDGQALWNSIGPEPPAVRPWRGRTAPARRLRAAAPRRVPPPSRKARFTTSSPRSMSWRRAQAS